MTRRLDERFQREQRDRRVVGRVLPFMLLAVVFHLILGTMADRAIPWFTPPYLDPGAPPHMVIVQLPEEDEEEEEEEEIKQPELEGQLVEVAPPEEEQPPEEADYVAEFNVTVPEETKTDLFKVNPEVVSPEFSEESKLEQADLMDVNVHKPSTGAQVGNNAFDPDRNGNLASLPSPWAVTNKDGLQDPVPSSHRAERVAGAPQNDLLDELSGDRVALNTKEYLYASYINRIRRLVNFYWEQNVDNLPHSVRLVRSAYTTTTSVVLDGDGALEIIEIVKASGSDELDDCVERAFKMAGPFPNPPAGLVEKDGRVYLPSMAFTVRQGQARMRYEGIDPRAGVQFPGILKSPR